jgi:DNA-binding transcriptional LysR family regulator
LDRIEAMRVFARVVERRSFSKAAEDLLLSRSKVSEAVQQLEAQLGVRLLERTTRSVAPTDDGEGFYRRCVDILARMDEADAEFGAAEPRGPLRVEVSGELARHFLLPGLPDFLARYPGISLHIGGADRLVDLVREGIDCVVRMSQPQDSGLVGRRVAYLAECTLASPSYLARHGTPTDPDALQGHRMVGFVSSATGAVLPLEFTTEHGIRHMALPTAATTSSVTLYAALARQGLGLIQVPRYNYEGDIAAGTLVEVLPEFPPAPSPVFILYPTGRHLPRRTRVFVDWAAAQFGAEAGR